MIAHGCKTYTSSILIQPDLNKCRLYQLAKHDKLYIDSASTTLLQIFKIYLIEYQNQIFPPYHFTYPITG